MGEVVDVASVKTARRVRGIYPTNRGMISRLIQGLTNGGHLVGTIDRIKETRRIAGLDAMSRAECIRTVENYLRVKRDHRADSPQPRDRRGDAQSGCEGEVYRRDHRGYGAGWTNEVHVPRVEAASPRLVTVSTGRRGPRRAPRTRSARM